MSNPLSEEIEALLAFSTKTERHAWITNHFPRPDKTLIKGLREEAYRRERINPRTSVQIARIVSEIAQLWQDRQTEGVALHIKADAHHLLGEQTQALEVYEQAVALYQNLGLEHEAARVAVGQFATMKDVGLYEESLSVAEWAGKIFRQVDDQLALGKLLLNRGNIYARLDRYDEARSCYIEARTIFTTLDDKRYLAITDVNDANVLSTIDDFRQAESLYLEARGYFEAETMISVAAQVDDNLAYLYFAQGQYQRALILFNKARAVFVNQRDAVKVAYVDFHRSDIYLALNLWQEALEMARAARPTFETANMTWETARLWLNEGAALARIQNQSPHAALDNARRIFDQENNIVWRAITDLYQATFDWRCGNFDVAREKVRLIQHVFEESGLHSQAAQCQIIQGEIALRTHHPALAADHFTQGLTQLENFNLPAVSFACHFGLGRAHQQQKTHHSAHHHLQQAIKDIERLQIAIGAEDYKIAFLNDKLQVYQTHALHCLAINTPEAIHEAFQTIERAKSRTLLDALVKTETTSPQIPADTDQQIELKRLKDELNWLYNHLNTPQTDGGIRSPQQVTNLTQAVTEREQSLSRLLTGWQTPDLDSVPNNPIWIVSPQQIQAVLPADTMVLEFYTANEQIIAFGISREVIWTRTLPDISCSEAADLLGELRFQIQKLNYGPDYRKRHKHKLQQSIDDCLFRWYKSLITPIESLLTAQSLIIIPHGLLHYVPFHTLFNGNSYLIDQKTISYAPSATILHRLLTAPKEDISSAAPLIMSLPDDTIPHARTEAEAIAGLFPNAQTCIGPQATASKLLNNGSKPAFLHLATHAAFRADNPLYSAIKLADTWVSVNDIYNIPNVAPLVTLSACETGRNQINGGDEFMGLARGFFSAGAKSLVVSLWAVDDNSTTELMTTFYHAIKNGEPVNQALQTAQLAIKSRLPHPYYWASFILTGNPQIRLTH